MAAIALCCRPNQLSRVPAEIRTCSRPLTLTSQEARGKAARMSPIGREFGTRSLDTLQWKSILSPAGRNNSSSRTNRRATAGCRGFEPIPNRRSCCSRHYSSARASVEWQLSCCSPGRELEKDKENHEYYGDTILSKLHIS